MVIGLLRLAVEEIKEPPMERLKRWQAATKKKMDDIAWWDTFMLTKGKAPDDLLNKVSQIKREYKEIIDKKSWRYLAKLRDSLPLTYAKYPKKSVASLALLFLCSRDKLHKKYLKETDTLSGSPVFICRADQSGRFRAKLYNAIAKYGTRLFSRLKTLDGLETNPSQLAPEIKKTYEAKLAIKLSQDNDSLNKLANEFRLPDFAPFARGGESHIDFAVTREIDSQSSHTKRRLYLEIQVAQK